MTTLYRLSDESDQLLYVGITDNLEKRLHSHSRNKTWWMDVTHCHVEEFDSRDQAASAEFNAIRIEEPKYNLVHKLDMLEYGQGDFNLEVEIEVRRLKIKEEAKRRYLQIRADALDIALAQREEAA